MQKLLDFLIETCLTQGCAPSACAAVGVGDTVLAEACGGSAPLPGDPPPDRHTLYDMASISKVLGPTMIALQALEQGKLSLEERVGDFFPAPQDKENITVRMLMTHTAGLTPTFRLDWEGIPPEEAVDAILRRPLDAAPGEGPIYSCMGFILLAKMLELRLGQPLDRLAREMVFAPLGMTETGYCPQHSTFAATDNDPQTGRPLQGVVHDENARFLRGVSGNAGVFMSLADGERFCRMLAAHGSPLLRPETLALAARNYTPGADTYRGLGFQMAGSPLNYMGGMPETSFGHTGFTGTSIAVEPRTGFWVLLLTNRVCPSRENSNLFAFRRAFHTALWQRVNGRS